MATQHGQGLQGTRVIEIGGGIAAPYAGRLLADLGATVVKLEPPRGDPTRHRGPFVGHGPAGERSGLFAVLNAGKRSVVADLASATGHKILADLVPHTDLLIHDVPPKDVAVRGLDWKALSEANPGLVVLAISPFGQSGPYRDFVASDLNLIHAGGWGWLCPGPGTDPQLPPIKPFGQHAWIEAAAHGTVAALSALHSARATGVGEYIDLSGQEAVLTVVGRNYASYGYAGQIDGRLSQRAYAPNGFFPSKDGHVYLVCIEEEQWQRLVELMGSPAWTQLPRFAAKEVRAEHEAELNGYLREWTQVRSSMELFKACQEKRICVSPVFDAAALPEQEHLKAREFPRHVDQPEMGALRIPGPPYRLMRDWWRPGGPAPRLGEAQRLGPKVFSNGTTPSVSPRGPRRRPGRPLEGIRVLDFSWVWAGPHMTKLLADLGADVVKVESAARLDILRRGGATATDIEPGVNTRGAFNQLALGKRSLQVNLSSKEGLAIVRELAAKADIVASNFGTGVMERFGLGAEDLQKLNPEAIVCAISGYGQTGPYRNYMGYGQAAVPLSGISALTGYEPGQPQEVHIAYGDPVAGVFGAVGIAAALVARQRYGGGQFIDVSLWESLICTGFEGWMAALLPPDPQDNPPVFPMGNRDPWDAPHNCYRCAGMDAWVSIAVTGEPQWTALCAAMGQPDLAQDARFRTAPDRKAHEDALDELISAWTRMQDRWDVTRLLQAAGVAAFPSLDARDLTDDPHLAARRYFDRTPHAVVGVRSHLSVPWRMSERPNGAPGPAPLMGQHTEEVLREWLAVDPNQIAVWKSAGVLN